MEYGLTWKSQDMPSGVPICLLRVSAPPMSVRASFGRLLWFTPTSRDWKGYTKRAGKSICNQLREMYGGSGVPNPRWIAWLMGYPAEWDDCAVTAMQSFPKSRRRSSRQPLKP